MNTIIIKEGKKYQLRNGIKTEVLKKANNGTNYKFEAKVKEPQYDSFSVLSWKSNGRYLTDNKDHDKDIIKEL